LIAQSKKAVYDRTSQLGKFCLINVGLGAVTEMRRRGKGRTALDVRAQFGDDCPNDFRRNSSCVGMTSVAATMLKTIAAPAVSAATVVELVSRSGAVGSALEPLSF
jgi:hypothetical protein